MLQEMQVQSLGQEDPLEEGIATYSNNLVWRIPWTEETGGLQSMESHRVSPWQVKLGDMHSFEEILTLEGELSLCPVQGGCDEISS